MTTIQNNLVYFSGPHGSGKTTLMKRIAFYYEDTMIPELYTRNLKFHTDETYRQLLKTAGRAVENFEYLTIAKANENKIILANRCIYDVLAYDQVYAKKGWISEDTFKLLALTKAYFRQENEEPYAIIVNPGFDITWRHLNSRWAKSDKKWNEEDMEYCKLACESFEQYRNNEKILYIDKEFDLESKLELEYVYEWMKNIKNNSKDNSKPLQEIKKELRVA